MSGILSYDERYKKNLAAYEKDMNSDIDENTAKYDKRAKTTTELYEGEIADTNLLYEDDLRANEVQKYINAREVAENNANLGLTDSGLNRTQQTAVQLSASNNAAKIERQRQSAVDELRRLMMADIAEIEDEKFSSEQSIGSGYKQMASEAASESYKADVEAANEYNKLLLEASNKATTTKNTDYQFLLEEVANNKADPNYCANLIAQHGIKYSLNTSDPEILSLLKRAEIKSNEFLHYGSTGTVYSDYGEDDSNKDDEGNYLKNYAPGRIKYNYKTDGSRDYKVKLVKHTNNWGGGIDNNDVIDIYYPDGTPVVTNLKLGDLKNKWLAQQLTNWTAGKKDKDIGKEVTINMDLRDEDF